MKREVKQQITGVKTKDGAGVSLVRVLGHRTVHEFDPILLLDSFDSQNPDDYTAGFPMHPHRGIETISYVTQGKMMHKDSLGNSDTIADGEIQWMTAGSGIFHEELLPASKRVLGVQLWLNLPAKDKMTAPTYHSIKNSDIVEIPLEGGMIRLLAGTYQDKQGYQSKFQPFDYYDIHLETNSTISVDTDTARTVILFTLLGDIWIGDTQVKEKTAVKLTEGDCVEIKSNDKKSQILLISTKPLQEPIAWDGAIVMNTDAELQQAYEELFDGRFLQEAMSYE